MQLTRHARRLLVSAALLIASPLALHGQAALLGRVTSPAGAPLPGLTVQLQGDAQRADTTDASGDYLLDGLAAGRYRLVVDGPGLLPTTREVSLEAGARRRVDFRLRSDTVVLEGVVVQGDAGRNRERATFEREPGVTARVISGESIKTLPGLAEADVLRAVEVLPGVISTSDFSSAFNVRGGSADQNLILLDGFPVFNPFHLGGLFSVFNSDAIARAELLAGGFGAEYGGRVSSVLTVETDPGAEDRLEVDGGISLLAARVLLRAPIPAGAARALGAERGRWMVSARRSYFDQLLRPVIDFPYHLTDLQGFAELGLRGGGRLSLTAYTGDDVLDLSEFEPPGSSADDSTSILRLRWNWGNRVVGLRWQQAIGSRWFADTGLGYSTFSDQLGFRDFGGIRFGSSIDQVTLRSRLERELGRGASVRLGASVERLGYDNFAEAGGTTFFSLADDGTLGSGFGSLRWQPTSDLIVEPGLRADLWRGSNSTRALLSPRFAVKRFLDNSRSAAVKLAVGRYTQFLHSLRDESFPVSNDRWVVASDAVPAVVSDQLQLGLEKFWGEEWNAAVEGYYRGFRGVTEVNLADDPNDPADDLLDGSGRSVGLDFFLRRITGRLTGWASVSVLRAERTLPDPLAAGFEDLPQTTTFAPVFDRRLDLDLVLQYMLPGRWEVGARWNYGSPIPYTRPVAQHFGFRYSPLADRYEPADGFDEGAPLFVVTGQRNAERYPPYHRLDATVRRTFQQEWGSWTPYLQVLNAYNRRNVLFYFYNYDRVPATRAGISMFPVLPALGVEVSF